MIIYRYFYIQNIYLLRHHLGFWKHSSKRLTLYASTLLKAKRMRFEI